MGHLYRITLVLLILGSVTWAAAPAKPKKTVDAATGAPMLPPPSTKPIADKDKTALEEGVATLGKQIEALRAQLKPKPQLLELLPDVVIFYNAVKYPLEYNEPMDVKQAKKALDDGMQRAKELAAGKAPWVTQTGPRGYLSKIDGSVQPYLLAVPKSYKPGDGKKYRLDFFCHGRGDTTLELKFINGKGEGSSTSTVEKFYAQPWGRYCCANKFAGEIDIFEIIDSLKHQYPIDENRIVLMGFSMGGAAVWHLSVHYADVWCAASPGAGFAETRIYQKLAEKGEIEKTPWYEQTLWHWYDAPDYINNLANLPLIAYAGTLDPQQESGTIMEKAAKAAGVPFERIWGQNVPHKYEPNAKKELDGRMDAFTARGRNPAPRKVKLETWTLRYNKMFWLTVDALDHHWQRTTVDGEITADGTIKLKTKNVSALSVDYASLLHAASGGSAIAYAVEIDGIKAGRMVPPANGKPGPVSFVKSAGEWRATSPSDDGLRKRHALQGPIDDAFLDKFVMVKPTGQPLNEKVGAWATAEMSHAVRQWHNIFRGDAPTKADTEITDDDIATSNLVLWGDPSSNAVLKKIADKLPVKWLGEKIIVGDQTFDGAAHAPVMIYPNPLNPRKYIVINSGFTFREDANSTNSRQVPRLPDWAVVDLTTPPNAHSPGKIAAAGFFGEKWDLLPAVSNPIAP